MPSQMPVLRVYEGSEQSTKAFSNEDEGTIGAHFHFLVSAGTVSTASLERKFDFGVR